MTAPDPCAALEAALPDWLEGTLAPEARAAVDDHLAGCARCAALVAALDRPAREDHALPEVQPARDLWPGIAARIAPRVLALPGAPGAVSAPWQRRVAAAALVVVSVAGTYLVIRPPGLAPVATDDVRALERALAEREATLDPATAAAVRQSLAIIDGAIADARAALAADSSDVLLDRQLTRMLGKRAGLLRRVTMLPART